MVLPLLGLFTALAADPAVLFLGNSYIFTGNLNVVTADLLRAGQADLAELDELRLAQAGFRFADHLAKADGTEGDTDWRAALVTGSTSWNWVILQDQSQIPGFPASNPEYRQSLESAVALDDLIEAKGAATVLLLTWGRRDGDATNPERFPDFATMEAYLEEGYRGYQEAIATAERPVDIAPAGPAFALVYAADETAGRDPRADGSVFRGLYVEDGSHPSLTGTWLAGYVLYGTLTQASPVGLPGPPGVETEVVELLQEAARAAVFDGEWVPAGSTGETDTDPPDTGSPGGDSAAPDDTSTVDGPKAVAEAEASGGLSEAEKGGCGCASVGSGSALPLAGLWVALLCRRRRQA